MVVFCIAGAPGTGKSFLTKQMACLNSSPAFFEGEKGVFTKDVLDVLNGATDTPKRFTWLLNKYAKNLEQAKEISAKGIDCYVDGGYFSVKAWLNAEIGKHSKAVLSRWLEKHRHLQEDKVIVLIREKANLVGTIRSRGRKEEQNEFIVQRALRVQKASIQLGMEQNALIIDRTQLDFEDNAELVRLKKKIDKIRSAWQAWPFS